MYVNLLYTYLDNFHNFITKSRIQETLKLSLCADSSPDTKTDRKGQKKENIENFHVSGVT